MVKQPGPYAIYSAGSRMNHPVLKVANPSTGQLGAPSGQRRRKENDEGKHGTEHNPKPKVCQKKPGTKQAWWPRHTSPRTNSNTTPQACTGRPGSTTVRYTVEYTDMTNQRHHHHHSLRPAHHPPSGALQPTSLSWLA